MIKRSFIGLAKPVLQYQALDVLAPEPTIIQPSGKVTLFIDNPYFVKDPILFKIGDQVKTGQKLSYSKESDAYVISTVSGTISSVTSFAGDYGKAYTAVTIDTDDSDNPDDGFAAAAAEPTLDTAVDFLAGMPGNPDFKIFADPEKPINTIIICGVDHDLLVTTNQYIVKSNKDAVKSGVRILKDITGVNNIILAVPQHLMLDAAGSGAEVRTIDSVYPATRPQLMMQAILGQVLPAGQNFEDLGVCFLSIEAVASIGMAFGKGTLPLYKTITLINKKGEQSLVSARIGTPLSDILNAANITVNEKDRIILGGPMTGAAVYSGDYPVQADTDAVIVQDFSDIPLVSDYPCINCGECIRICPASVPINLLVRFLEAGQYEEAADMYDLYSCIECGLCSFVCVSKMPILHYIKLAKYELGRIHSAEATNV